MGDASVKYNPWILVFHNSVLINRLIGNVGLKLTSKWLNIDHVIIAANIG
jgi:hypothetical protein